MDAMTKLLKKRKKLIHEIAEKNTIRDRKGNIVFNKGDPWVMDDTWDELYAKMIHDESSDSSL